MGKYAALENILASLMSVETGLSEEREEALLQKALEADDYRAVLRKELQEAFADAHFSWKDLLDNETYCVVPADSEEEARCFVEERLWKKIVRLDSVG